MGQTTSGTQLFVSLAKPATHDKAGYEALTWIEIGEVTDFSDYGRVYNPVNADYLNQRRTAKFKGNYNEGDPTITVTRNGDDAGQVACETARDMDEDVSFKVLDQKGAADYFDALVMSYNKIVGAADNMLTASIQVGINTDIVEVPAP